MTGRFSRTLGCALLAGYVLTGVVSAAGAPGIVVEVESIGQLVADADTLGGGTGIPLRGATVKAMLGGALMTPELQGVNTNAPLRLYVMFPEAPAAGDSAVPPSPQPVVVVPLSNGTGGYLDALKASFSEHEESGGIHHFSAPVMPVANMSEWYVQPHADRAFCGPDADAVGAAVAAGDTDMEQHLGSLPGTVRIGVNVPACISLVEYGIAAAGAGMQQQPSPAMPGMEIDPKKILEAEGNALIAVMKQIEALTLGVKARERTLDLYSRVAPVSGSALHQVFHKRRSPSRQYMNSVPSDTPLAIVNSGMDAFDVIAEPYGEFVATVYEGMGPAMAKAGATMKQMVADLAGLFSGDFSLVVTPMPDGTIGFVETIAVTDPVRAETYLDKSLALSKDMCADTGMGFNVVEKEPRTYAGVNIRSFSYKVTPGENMDAQAQMAMMPGLAFLKKMSWESAVHGKNLLYSMGGPEVMNAAIDRLNGAGVDIMSLPKFSRLIPKMNVSPTGVWTIAPLDFLRTIMRMFGVGEQQLAAIPRDTDGIAGYSVMQGDAAICATRISYSEVSGLMQTGPVLGQLAMQCAMQMGAAAMPAGPEAAQGKCMGNLMMIESAKQQYALEHGLQEGDTIEDPSKLNDYLGGAMPTCPSGGQYKINPIGTPAECSIPGHALPH